MAPAQTVAASSAVGAGKKISLNDRGTVLQPSGGFNN
jgi:hypothetical protein